MVCRSFFRTVLPSLQRQEQDGLQKRHDPGQDRGLGLHDLRHRFVSRKRAEGVQDFVIRAIVGHKSESMTERLTSVSQDTLLAAVREECFFWPFSVPDQSRKNARVGNLFANPLILLVGRARFELATNGLKVPILVSIRDTSIFTIAYGFRRFLPIFYRPGSLLISWPANSGTTLPGASFR